MLISTADERILTAGNRRMTIHFSEAESNISSDITYEDLLKNLWIG